MQINTIISTSSIAEKISKLLIYSPEISKKSKAGQFIILRINEEGERIPLTIVDTDKSRGTITLIVQDAGKTTHKIVSMGQGESIRDLVGPLGNPSDIRFYGNVAVIGGGVGAAVGFPVAKALKQVGNHVTSIIGARSKDLVILEDEIRSICDECYITTDDGSYGMHGFVTTQLEQLLLNHLNFDHIFAIGPVPMMRSVSELTRTYHIPTTVSLNTIMVDGTGMCGGCRVRVGDKTLFTCVDGPEFDGHLVDFEMLTKRNRTYIEEEHCALDETIESLKSEKQIKPVKIQRQKMPERNIEDRIKTFDEVNLGFFEEIARIEAQRCLQCRKPLCVEGCPVGVKIPEFIKLLENNQLISSAYKIQEDNVLARVCARVCPQSDQCEGACILNKRGESVAIGALARFVTDYANNHEQEKMQFSPTKTGKKIAIVGSGPAGLSCAGDLIKSGHDVTVFEAFHDFGGVLIYGIPEFRLPKDIVKSEVHALKELGVDFQANTVIGLSFTIDELLQEKGFDALFISVGAGLPRFLNIPGENLVGIYSANEFLTRVNLMKAWKFPAVDTPVINVNKKIVAVIGGGNTALDSARVALRMGAKEVYIIYRRSDKEMPGRLEEIMHAKDEGIHFMFLENPIKFTGDDTGWVNNIKLISMELGEPDASGRRSPKPIPDSEHDFPIDVVVIAIGNGSNPIIQKTTPDLVFNTWGNIIVDPDTLHTSKLGVFAGGDIVTGGATVILAMGAGRKAAASINKYLATNNI